eukprot:364385-Chlamydomonas_euryale.AAC.2
MPPEDAPNSRACGGHAAVTATHRGRSMRACNYPALTLAQSTSVCSRHLLHPLNVTNQDVLRHVQLALIAFCSLHLPFKPELT